MHAQACDPPEPRSTDLADELLAARAHLRRRIETLELAAEATSFGDAAGSSLALIAELSGVLHEIDLRLAEVGSEDRMTTSPPVI